MINLSLYHSWSRTILTSYHRFRRHPLTIRLTRMVQTVTATPQFQKAAKIYHYYCLYHLWESAFSQLLVVDTCRHGTDPLSWGQITCRGFDPQRGGKGGEVAYWKKRSGGIANVTRNNSTGSCFLYRDMSHQDWKHAILVRLYPRRYAMMAGIGTFGTPHKSHPLLKALSFASGGALGLLTPTIKVHYEPRKQTLDYPGFQLDWNYANKYSLESPIAIMTDRRIGRRYIGPVGILYVGTNRRMLERIDANPSRFLLGVVQACLAAGLTAKLLRKPFDLPCPRECRQLWANPNFRFIIEQAIWFSSW